METSKDRLTKAQVGRQLALAQQTAIDRLNDIIEAIKDEQQKKKEFKDDPSGGGGGGGGGKPKLIPPLAQLKLLKSQQMVINRDTASTYKELDAAKTAEDKGQLQAHRRNSAKSRTRSKTSPRKSWMD